MLSFRLASGGQIQFSYVFIAPGPGREILRISLPFYYPQKSRGLFPEVFSYKDPFSVTAKISCCIKGRWGLLTLGTDFFSLLFNKTLYNVQHLSLSLLSWFPTCMVSLTWAIENTDIWFKKMFKAWGDTILMTSKVLKETVHPKWIFCLHLHSL